MRLIRTGALLLGLLAFCLVSCDPPLTQGYVYNKQYDPAWVQYIPGHYYDSCSRIGKSEECEEEYVPGYVIDNPAEYYLDITTCSNLRTDGKCQTGWVDVDEYVYDHTQVGSYYGNGGNQ